MTVWALLRLLNPKSGFRDPTNYNRSKSSGPLLFEIFGNSECNAHWTHLKLHLCYNGSFRVLRCGESSKVIRSDQMFQVIRILLCRCQGTLEMLEILLRSGTITSHSQRWIMIRILGIAQIYSKVGEDDCKQVYACHKVLMLMMTKIWISWEPNNKNLACYK